MFIDVDRNFSHLRPLEAHFDEIRAEALAVPIERYREWYDPNAYAGAWKLFILHTMYADWEYAKDCEPNRELCPRTWELVKDIPNKVMVGFSYISPKTHVYPHHDKVVEAAGYDHSARCHMGIKIPKAQSPVRVGEVVSEYQEGRFLAFDGGKYEHEVGNMSDEGRITFCIELLYDPATLVE